MMISLLIVSLALNIFASPIVRIEDEVPSIIDDSLLYQVTSEVSDSEVDGPSYVDSSAQFEIESNLVDTIQVDQFEHESTLIEQEAIEPSWEESTYTIGEETAVDVPVSNDNEMIPVEQAVDVTSNEVSSVEASSSAGIHGIGSLDIAGSIGLTNTGIQVDAAVQINICPIFKCFKWCPYGYLIGKDNCLSCVCAPLFG